MENKMYFTDLFIIDALNKCDVDVDWDNGIEDTFADN